MVNKKELESRGYSLVKTWGTPQKVKYYRPDGGEVWKVPGYVEDGKGVQCDILLLRGYTLTPPEHPKFHCNGCTKWHDTQEQVDACIKAHRKSEAEWAKKANKLYKKETEGEVGELRNQVAELQKMVKQLLEQKK